MHSTGYTRSNKKENAVHVWEAIEKQHFFKQKKAVLTCLIK